MTGVHHLRGRNDAQRNRDFHAQRDAAEQVHTQLLEVSRLLRQLSTQANALATDKDLRAVLREEQHWLAEARQLVAEVRYFRQSVDHRWPASCVAGRLRACSRWRRRWRRARATEPSAIESGEDASLRNRAAFADAILERLDAMTPAERRQFDRLMKEERGESLNPEVSVGAGQSPSSQPPTLLTCPGLTWQSQRTRSARL